MNIRTETCLDHEATKRSPQRTSTQQPHILRSLLTAIALSTGIITGFIAGAHYFLK